MNTQAFNYGNPPNLATLNSLIQASEQLSGPLVSLGIGTSDGFGSNITVGIHQLNGGISAPFAAATVPQGAAVPAGKTLLFQAAVFVGGQGVQVDVCR